MKVNLFPFQEKALRSIHVKTVEAVSSYKRTDTPQVISFTAPTGAGKTIIMSALIEDIYFGNDQFEGQPEAIFLWLSDSPQLNEQSKLKISTKADKILHKQCITVSDDSFDDEMFQDGHIYFLNTQKLSRSSNLTRNGDNRAYTIWETIANTICKKNDHFYVIIDEAHRGMNGDNEIDATTIMQKFLLGSGEDEIPPMPVVIGMSATTDRFNRLVEGTVSTIQKVIITAKEVQDSGLLKDRIVITYPEADVNNDISILQAAAEDWREKCVHWDAYCNSMNVDKVNPVFVIQVLKGTARRITDSNLSEIITTIEERTGISFSSGEIVHTFMNVPFLNVNGVEVPYVEPSKIMDDKNIKVVLFKENLSTGWDCPRAETMMSFKHASDSTYIAQLLGRMVRTPKQMHISEDDTLNDVHLYLPYFNRNTVNGVIEALQREEGSTIPTEVSGESLDNPDYEVLTVKPSANSREALLPGNCDREKIRTFINEFGLLNTCIKKTAHNHNYLKSLFSLAHLLERTGLDKNVVDTVKKEISAKIHDFIENLKATERYEELAQNVNRVRLAARIFDPFGDIYDGNNVIERATTAVDIDRQFQTAESKFKEGIGYFYGNEYYREYESAAFKIDFILYVADRNCMSELDRYAKKKFHDLNDCYRRYFAYEKLKNFQKEYEDIVSDGDDIIEDNFKIPETIINRYERNGNEYRDHLFINEKTGVVRFSLNTWEKGVIQEEERQPDFICWLRNSANAQWALCIPYKMNNQTKAMYPDFIIIRKDPAESSYIIDILEPHSPALTDNLCKAKGLAEYAYRNKGVGRIQLIREIADSVGRRFKRLDMAKDEIRERVSNAYSNEELDHLFDEFGFTM